ncbi:MAG: host attachment protein [Rhizobiales bacterium]|nr:host attachment protein [Hyphomicrobiales bacterium]MBI3672260.1 host attachment protein [Hyphomicrobiales bacterium]
MKRLSQGTRVLVADGARALIYRNDGDAIAPNLKLVRAYAQDNPASHDQGSDKPGRVNDSFGRRSSMEITDWHRVAEDRFIDHIAGAMAKELAAGDFAHIVVVAPPIALGEFRRAASPALAKATLAEIDKDLTRHTVDSIEKSVLKALEAAGFKS